MRELKNVNERKGSLRKEAEAVLTAANIEQRDVSPAENIRLDRIKSEIFNCDQEIAKIQAELRMDHNRSARSTGEMNLEGYSILRALNGAAGGKLEGLAREVSDEIAHRSGVNPAGFFIPNSALVEKRGMSVTGDAGIYGGSAVQTDISEDFLAALRPLSRVIAAGASIFSGLSHSLAFPAQAAASTAAWKTEVAALDEVTSEIGQITLAPKRVGAFTEVSNQLLIQTNAGVERFVKQDLLAAIATAIDAAAIAGAGSPAPTGVCRRRFKTGFLAGSKPDSLLEAESA